MKTLTPEQFKKRYGEVGVELFKQSNQEKKPGFVDRTKESALQGAEKMRGAFADSLDGRNPISTGAKLGAGAIETLFSPVTAAVEPVVKPTLGKGLGAVTEKISNIPAAQDFAMSDAGEVTSRVAEDIANISGIAGVATMMPLGARAVIGAKAGVEGALNSVDDLTREVAKTAQAGAGSQPAKIMQRVARIPKLKQANFEKMAGESVGEYLTRRGIYGSIDDISTKLYERFSKSKSVADKALAELPGSYAPAPVKTALAELLKRELRTSTKGAPSPIVGKVGVLYRKINKEGLTMSEINEAKRLFERTVKVDYLKQNLPESVARANNIDDAIRRWQFKQAETLGLKNLPRINKETRLAKQLLDDLGREYSGQAGNNAMSLTDWIMLSGGDPTAISGFLVKKSFSSKSVQSAIAKALNKGREIQGDVLAEFGESQIKQLPAGGTGAKTQITKPINLPSSKAIKSGTEIVPRGKDNGAVRQTVNSGKVKTMIPKELIQEARKYKSAEEFVLDITDSTIKGKGRIYEGLPTTPRAVDDFNLGKQQINKINATQRQTSPEVVTQWKKRIEAGERPPVLTRTGLSESQEWIMDGHNRLKAYQELGFTEVPTITKSQLTDIWRKANGKK